MTVFTGRGFPTASGGHVLGTFHSPDLESYTIFDHVMNHP